MIWFRFLRLCGTHHTQSGSSWSSLVAAYSVTFQGIDILDICKTFPTCGPIIPFNARVPTNRGLLHLYVDFMIDEYISMGDRMAISSVIHNAFHQVELVALFIALCIHIMGDHIDGVLISMPIWKIYLLGPCIQQGSIELPLATNHTSSTDLVPNQDSHTRAEILVIRIDVILNIIGIQHGLRRNMAVLVVLMDWHIKVSKVRVVLVFITGHRGSQFVSAGLVILKGQLFSSD
jgi:hypothetical protein